MSVIDLDQPADPATGGAHPPLSRSFLAGIAVIALLVGAAVGGVITHRWTVHRAEAVEGGKVSLLLFADQQAGGSNVDRAVNDDGTVQVTFNAAIAVVNAGPDPIEIQSLTARKTGLTMAGSARSPWISPGTSLLFYVDITGTCVIHKSTDGTGATVNDGITQATASVRTSSDSIVTISSLSFDASPWATKFLAAVEKCLRPPP